MKPSPPQRSSRISRRLGLLKFVCLILPFALNSFAKEAPLSAIVLFNAPSGPAYVQLTGVTLNGKTELRTCDGVLKIDKRSYDILPRVQLKASSVLERK